MTSSHVPRKKKSRGAMRALRYSGGSRNRTPLWQWIVGIPAVVLILAAIVAYIYITYFNPRSVPLASPTGTPAPGKSEPPATP